MPKVLFLTLHRPDRSPSQRFRFEQYLSFLEENGFEYEFSWLLGPEDDKIFYKPGNFVGKFKILMKSISKRRREIKRSQDYDIIFVQREGFMLGSTYFERKISQKSRLIFDFDDAIWIHSVSKSNKMFGWLKNPNKTKELIKMANLVIAGNDYLASYAKGFNDSVEIIPTTIDTEEYKKVNPEKSDDRICIGWSGSITTIEHFKLVEPLLQRLKDKFGERIYFKVIGDGSYVNEKLGIKGIAWRKDGEVKELCEIDIGLMPLPDDEWAKGKCGLKGLQYMALEIATIMSPVGVNADIIETGVNGVLAVSEDEWFASICDLIENPSKLKSISEMGRKTVLEQYSVDSQKNRYLRMFQDVLKTEA
ncbi:MAG: glycosyltransferase family 4 protein [Flavobacteriales bacterium]|nr:glycosyltransferase family 4 protein [Flavobacteriales bacterium]